jgi:signal transduction histidine kinase
LINAQEAARADIARDLHDDICQEMVSVSMTVSSLKRLSGSIQDAGTQETLSQLERAVFNTVEGIRRLSHDLHPASLRLLGLASTLKGHCLEVEKRHAVHVTFTSRGDLSDLAPDVAVCLFRIVQEALRNGIVHGAARRLMVSLGGTADHVQLTVADDGRGFDLEAVRRGGGGLGLVSIEERAHVVGGTAQIVTRLQQGTTIAVRVPIVTSAPAGSPNPPVVGQVRAVTGRLQRAMHAVMNEISQSTKLLDSSRGTVCAADGAAAPLAAGDLDGSANHVRGTS